MEGLSGRTPYAQAPSGKRQWVCPHAAGTRSCPFAGSPPGMLLSRPQAKQLQPNHIARDTGGVKPGREQVGRKDGRHSELGVIVPTRQPSCRPLSAWRPRRKLNCPAGSGQQAGPCSLPSLSSQTPERMGNVFSQNP